MIKINRQINHQYQDLHIPESDVSRWVELQEVERDICLLYHQLSEYSYIMSDFYYGNVYALRYWDFLDVGGIEPDRQSFIREGCLIMILAMAWDMIDGSGAFLKPRLAEVSAAVEDCSSEDERTRKLLAVVKLGLELASGGRSDTAEFVDLSNWAHREFVRGY
ncbi:MAG: hypothetical protein OEU25_14455, partial [Rhodospirillales bacterium]|nr:hypothetical protein [Rhodospirillales bacterium]